MSYSTDSLRPIPTRYAGHQFRSRIEARWAVFFDALNIEWEYEPRAFSTGAGGYLPDFRLPSLHCQMHSEKGEPTWFVRGCWFEVKPAEHSTPFGRREMDLAYRKMRHVSVVTKKPGFIAAGSLPILAEDQDPSMPGNGPLIRYIDVQTHLPPSNAFGFFCGAPYAEIDKLPGLIGGPNLGHPTPFNTWSPSPRIQGAFSSARTHYFVN